MSYLRIVVDADAGEAELIAGNAFSNQSGLWRADVLQDVIGMATAMYDQAIEDMHAELEALASGEE